MCYGAYCVPSHNSYKQREGNITRLTDGERIERVCILIDSMLLCTIVETGSLGQVIITSSVPLIQKRVTQSLGQQVTGSPKPYTILLSYII